MPTLSQFKSKYIIERRSKNVGDEGTKNIVKKLLGKDAIPDDGGKAGQARIEKELELNKNNTTTNRRGRRVINKKYTPPDKVTSQNIQTKSIVNQANKVKDNLRTVDKTINTNVVKGSGEGVSGSKGDTTVKPNTNTVTNTKKTTTSKNVVKPDKFSDVVKKFQGSTSNTSNVGVSDKIKQIQQDYLNKLKDQKPKVNINQTPTTNPTLPNFTKQKTNFSGRLGNVTNITKNKGAQIPDFVKNNPNPIKDVSSKKEIQRIIDRDRLNRGLKNLDTSDFDKQKLSKRAFQDFKKDATASSIKTKVAKSPKLAKALKFGGPVLGAVDSAITFRNTYKQSQAQGDTKARSVGKAASKVAGGLIGGALGAAGGSAIAPGAGTYVGGVGGYVAGQAAGEKLFNTLTTSKGRKQIAKSFKNFRNRAMKPIGG